MDREKLNAGCRPLDEAARGLAPRFSQAGLRFTTGWYDGRRCKNASGRYETDCFPIPALSVVGLRDSAIGLERTSVTAKLPRTRALADDYRRLAGYAFEAYGAEDRFTDNSVPGDTALLKRLRESREKEIEYFPREADAAICTFTAFLWGGRFHS